ncbi:MAG: hypothetical protein R3E64_17955 [Halioglobus sp.]
MKNIPDHSASAVTIGMDQGELLLVMALVQEGRQSFGCNTDAGRAVEALFCSAKVLVEYACRRNLTRPLMRQRIQQVATPEPAQQRDSSVG